MKKLVLANQKGGVGKSILAYHFAHYLADKGKKVLFIDTDEQANSSKSLKAYCWKESDSSALFSPNFQVNTENWTLPILSLKGDVGLRAVEKAEQDGLLIKQLQANLKKLEDAFDYCVFDTPGANSKVANAVLIVSDFVLIPCIVDTYSIDVATKMLQRVLAIQKKINPKLVNLGLLPNLFDATAPSQKKDLETLLKHYHAYCVPAKVSKRTGFRDAAADSLPVWQLKKTTAREAAKELRYVFDLLYEKMEKTL